MLRPSLSALEAPLTQYKQPTPLYRQRYRRQFCRVRLIGFNVWENSAMPPSAALKTALFLKPLPLLLCFVRRGDETAFLLYTRTRRSVSTS